jgi:Tfp pilus assembly protein FimT
MVMSMNAARSEAIKQDVATGVSVCPTADGKTCDTSAGASWAQGWIVVSTVANSIPVMTMQGLPTDTRLAEASALPAVTFLSDGTVLAAAAFTMCDARGAQMGRYIQVTSTGRVASSKGKKLNGAALTCPP